MTVRAYERYALNSSDLAARTPAHWRVLRLRYAVDLNPSARRAGLKPEQEVSFLPMEAIGDDGTIDRARTCVVGEASSGYSYFADGDVVLAKITPCFENGKAAQLQELHGGHGFGTTELIVVRPEGALMLSHFLYYVVHSSVFRDLGTAHMYGAGGQKRVPDEFVRNLRVALPPMPEQHHIVAFLDRETAKIDALVAEQRRLMELLREKRQAVISHAVTKGLNPDAPMKPSGVEWLGDIPAHWHAVRLKSLLAMPLMYGASEASEYDDPDLPRFIRITDIRENGTLRDDTFKSLPHDVAGRFLLTGGDILFARSGATVGKSFLFSAAFGVACFAGYLIRARLDGSKCLPEWLYMFSQSHEYWSYIVGTQSQATIQNVNAAKYASMSMPVPPLNEQKEILTRLQAATEEIDSLLTTANRVVELLQERRSALISAAVTGQIDVRQFAAAEAA